MKNKSFKKDFLCILFLLLLSLVYFSPSIIKGKIFLPADLLFLEYPWMMYEHQIEPRNPEPSDAVQQHYPWRVFYQKSINTGEVPLWNPHQFCGQPFSANDQSAVYYPLNLILYGLFSAPVAYTISAWLHLFLGGFFMFLLMRYMRAGRAGAVLAAVVFMFNGLHIVWMAHAAKQAAMIWAPLVFLMALVALEKKERRAAWLCAGIVGVMLTAGFLQFASYTLFALAILFLFYMVAAVRRGLPEMKHVLFCGVVIFGVGLAVAAVHLLPVLELADYSSRPEIKLNGLWFTAIDLKHIINFILPDFFGNPVDQNLQDGVMYTKVTFYLTAPVMLLALAGMFLRNLYAPENFEKIRRWFFILLFFFSLASTFGFIVYAAYYFLVPGAESLLVPRIGYLATFACAILSGMGLGALLKMLSSLNISHASGTIKFLPAVTASAVILLVCYMLIPWGMKFNTFVDSRLVFPSTPTIDYLVNAGKQKPPGRVYSGDFKQWTLFPDVATAIGLDDVRGYDSLYHVRSRRFLYFMQKHWGKSPVPPPSTISAAPTVDHAAPLDWINTAYVLSRRELDAPGYRKVMSADINIYANTRARRRVLFSDAYRIEQNATVMLEEIVSPEHDPAKMLLLERPPEIAPAKMLHENTPGGTAGYKVVEWKANEIILDVSLDRDMLMFISDTHFPGWRAEIDGRETEVLRADYIFRAVSMPVGSHRFRMWFSPLSVTAGLAISLVAITIVFAGALLSAPPQEQ